MPFTLKHYWTLDEQSDGTAAVPRAASVGGITLTDGNDVPSSPPLVGGGRSALFSRAEQQRLSIDSPTADVAPSSPGQGWFWSLWVRPGEPSGFQEIISNVHNGVTAYQHNLYLEPDGDLFWFLKNDIGQVRWLTLGNLASDQTVHVVIGCTANRMYGWIDGERYTGGFSTVTGFTFTNTSPIYFGTRPAFTGSAFNGELDEIFFAEGIPSPAEVAWLYNDGQGRDATAVIAGVPELSTPPTLQRLLS